MTFTKSQIQLRVEADLAGDSAISEFDPRHLRILAAAVQECSQKGFKAATMAGVAKRARVSTATLYRTCRDKTDLFFQSVAYLLPLLAESVTKEITNTNPFELILAMLTNHGQAIGDPFMTWLYRLYVTTSSEEHALDVALLARAGRTVTQAHWSEHLSQLEAQGFLRPSPHAETINLLLGQIERRTILAQLLFGNDDVSEPSLEAAAHFAATALFANLGTPAYREAFPEP